MNSPYPKILVGITQRVECISGRDEFRDSLDQRLVQWILHAGFLPVVIPNTLLIGHNKDAPALKYWLQSIKLSALILSGGNDIGESSDRDATERYLLSWAEINRLPVLGICRGLQMMAVWAGVDLIKVTGHVRSRHSLIQTALNNEWPINVNSYHNWGLAKCPNGFEVAAIAGDGTIEAIKHIELPWEGWMWHPERETNYSMEDIKRLKDLFGGS